MLLRARAPFWIWDSVHQSLSSDHSEDGPGSQVCWATPPRINTITLLPHRDNPPIIIYWASDCLSHPLIKIMHNLRSGLLSFLITPPCPYIPANPTNDLLLGKKTCRSGLGHPVKPEAMSLTGLQKTVSPEENCKALRETSYLSLPEEWLERLISYFRLPLMMTIIVRKKLSFSILGVWLRWISFSWNSSELIIAWKWVCKHRGVMKKVLEMCVPLHGAGAYHRLTSYVCLQDEQHLSALASLCVPCPILSAGLIPHKHTSHSWWLTKVSSEQSWFSSSWSSLILHMICPCPPSWTPGPFAALLHWP